jgi:hypothetical protein
MKVQVSKLKPNPYRRMEEYPVDAEKVASLKASINETTFWDNILARPVGGFYEIAYGHHRLIALRELKVKEIDIPVRDLDDGTMIKIMANENRDTYKSNRAVTLETVRVARDFLQKEMAGEWEVVSKFIHDLFQSKQSFANARSQGIGWQTILKFLGGSWKAWEVQEALAQLNEKDIVPGALDAIPHLATAQSARNAIKEFKIPKAHQKAVVSMVKDESQHKIRDAIKDVVDKHKWIRPETAKATIPDTPPMLDDRIDEIIGDIGSLSAKLQKVRGHLSFIQNKRLRESLKTQAKVLRGYLEEVLQKLEDDNGNDIQTSRRRIG